MSKLQWSSRIGDYRASYSIQGRRLVRDRLWRKENRRGRRRQNGPTCHGNKRSRNQRKRIDEQGSRFQRLEREQRKEAREEKMTPARRPMPDATQSKNAAGRKVRKA